MCFEVCKNRPPFFSYQSLLLSTSVLNDSQQDMILYLLVVLVFIVCTLCIYIMEQNIEQNRLGKKE